MRGRKLALERKPAQEVRREENSSGTLERVPQSVVQVAGDSVLATLRHRLPCRSTSWASHRLASFVSRSVSSITSTKIRRSFRFHRTVQNRCREAIQMKRSDLLATVAV